jgi:hypothetical protein
MPILILLLMGFILGAVYGSNYGYAERGYPKFMLVLMLSALALAAISVVNTLPFVLP